jgi:acetylornithine deacetylase
MQVVGAVSEELVVDVTKELLRYPSFLGDEGPVGEHLAARMKALGYHEVIVQEVVRNRYNVIGILRGSDGDSAVMLNGHLDIPPVVEGWTRNPFDPVVEDEWIYGQGVTDMKGGLAAIVAAGSAIARSGAKLKSDLVVAAVMHHDTTGLGTKYLLQAFDAPWRYGIVAEPSDLEIQLAHGGACQFEIIVGGRPAHVSSREDGVNAITKALPILQELTDETFTHEPDPHLPYLPRVVVGVVAGGMAPGITAPSCSIRGDVRINSSMTPTTVQRDLDRLVARLSQRDPELAATVRILATQRPYIVDSDEEVVRVVRNAHLKITGLEPRTTTDLPCGAGVTDTSDLMRIGIPSVFYGPTRWKMVPDERARVHDLVTAARVYMLSALQLCGMEEVSDAGLTR